MRRAFTLVELLLALALAAFLILGATRALQGSRLLSENAERRDREHTLFQGITTLIGEDFRMAVAAEMEATNAMRLSGFGGSSSGSWEFSTNADARFRLLERPARHIRVLYRITPAPQSGRISLTRVESLESLTDESGTEVLVTDELTQLSIKARTKGGKTWSSTSKQALPDWIEIEAQFGQDRAPLKKTISRL